MKKKVNPLTLIIVLMCLMIAGVLWAYNEYFYPSQVIYSTYGQVNYSYNADEVNTINVSCINHNIVIKKSSDENIKISYYQKVDNSNKYREPFDRKLIELQIAESVEKIDNFVFKSENKISTITIYIPEGKTITFKGEAVYGTISVENCQFNSLSFETINGSIDIKDSIINNLTLNCNDGTIAIDGSEFKNVDIDNVSGNVTMNLINSFNDYESDILSRYGSLSINNISPVEIDEETQQEKVVSYLVNKPEGAKNKIKIVSTRSKILINSVEPPVEEENNSQENVE